MSDDTCDAPRAARSNAFDVGEETYVPARHRTLNFLEQELAEHTCSFGEQCRLKVRAAQLRGQS